MGLRVYALYNRNRVIGSTSIAFVALRTALAIYIGFFLQSPAGSAGTNLESLTRCRIVSPDPTSFVIYRQFIDAALSFSFDLFVLLLTIRRSYSHVLEMRRLGLGQHGVAQVFLRDGIFYFTIMLAMSCVMALMGMLSMFIGGNLAPESSIFFDVAIPFWIAVPNLLINRLVLNLRTCSCSLPLGHTSPSTETLSEFRPGEFR